MKDDLDKVFKALADPTRRHILDLLREKPAALLCVIHGCNEVATIQDVVGIGNVVRSGFS